MATPGQAMSWFGVRITNESIKDLVISVNIGLECAIEVSLTSLAPPPGRLIYETQ